MTYKNYQNLRKFYISTNINIFFKIITKLIIIKQLILSQFINDSSIIYNSMSTGLSYLI